MNDNPHTGWRCVLSDDGYCKTPRACVDHECTLFVAKQPLRQRPGDQVLPTKNDNPAIQDLVIADMEARKEIGKMRYGTLLQAHNGRDFLKDAYDEALDLCNYLRGAMYERDGK